MASEVGTVASEVGTVASEVGMVASEVGMVASEVGMTIYLSHKFMTQVEKKTTDPFSSNDFIF